MTTLRSWSRLMLLNRFLGNKAAILDSILEVTASRASPGDRVLDVFSGSLAVSMGYKYAGYRVTANDMNRLSETFARAYLLPADLPDIDLEALVGGKRARLLRPDSERTVEQLVGASGFGFLQDSCQRSRYTDLVTLLRHLDLADEDHLPLGMLRSDFYDHYCPDGAHSRFVSSRGVTGRRRYFTDDNARKLDLVMSIIRYWRRKEALSEHLLALCLAVTCYAVEKIANTQGTYHDFIRERWDSRAFKPLTLTPPPLDSALSGIGGHVVAREDSSEFVRRAGHHRVMYVDPPYNFRQYSAYYFLPNFICAYPDIDDLDSYFSEIRFVRGQHPSDNTSSVFCSTHRFLDAMHDLIADADIETVVLSYFTGRNHWSDFDRGRDDTGLCNLERMLRSNTFVKGSLRVTEIPRRNYASYVGYNARDVTELLLLVDKR